MLERVWQGTDRVQDAKNSVEASIIKAVDPLAQAAGDRVHGDAPLAGNLSYGIWRFAELGLEIGAAFAGEDEIGICQLFF